MRVLIVVRKDILNKVMIENRTNQVNHLYYITLDIREIDPVTKKYLRKTKIVNLYDNKVGNRYVWQGSSFIVR